MLYKRGIIRLAQEIQKQEGVHPHQPHHLRGARHAHLSVVLNGAVRLHYDTHDSMEIDLEYLRGADFYFKRSFSSEYIATLGESFAHKIYPLGLNYLAYPDQIDTFSFKRNYTLKPGRFSAVRSYINMIDNHNLLKFKPRVHDFESAPNFSSSNKMIFMAKSYDPYDDLDRDEDKIAERITNNDYRAKCISLLKQQFKEAFFGGFVPSTYAVQHYPDLIVPDAALCSKQAYTNLLKSFSIGVATTGVHGSIGWKLSEYVALSMAILSEPLNYAVPGDFAAGKNYLEFSTPEECVHKAHELFTNRTLRNAIMANNARYYQMYLRPDSLVLNSLKVASSGGRWPSDDDPTRARGD